MDLYLVCFRKDDCSTIVNGGSDDITKSIHPSTGWPKKSAKNICTVLGEF